MPYDRNGYLQEIADLELAKTHLNRYRTGFLISWIVIGLLWLGALLIGIDATSLVGIWIYPFIFWMLCLVKGHQTKKRLELARTNWTIEDDRIVGEADNRASRTGWETSAEGIERVQEAKRKHYFAMHRRFLKSLNEKSEKNRKEGE